MHKILYKYIKFVNLILVIAPFLVVWFSYYEHHTMTAASKQVSFLFIFIYTVVFFHLAYRLDGFRVSIRRIGELIFGQAIALLVTEFFALLIIWMLSIHFPDIIHLIICYLVQCMIIAFCARYSHILFYATHPPKKSVVIYDQRQGMNELISSYGMEKRYDVVASYPIEEVVNNSFTAETIKASLDEKFEGIDTVFLCGIHSHERNIILKYCIYNNKRAFMIPRIGDMIMSSAERMHMFHLPFLRVVRYNPPTEYKIIKRIMDIVLSGIAFVVALPFIIAVAIAVKSDGGPALYRQVRLTKDGKQFQILKFRSMCVDAEKYSGAVLSAGENDPRITKVGRFIRACRLDELPQLWNIFAGDMSIVGPRPERPEIASQYEKEFPEFALRLQCKCGLTGYAQVYGKYNTTPYDKTIMDLMYVANPSILEDLTIIMATVKILFSKESTEGVGEGQETSLAYIGKRSSDEKDE